MTRPDRELGIAVRQLTKAVSRIELERLQTVFDNNETQFWSNLPIGISLNTYKAKRAQAYYLLLISETQVVGYLLLVRNKIELEVANLLGWTVAHSYVKPEVRKIGLMRRVYDLILTKGRMISSPVQTPQGSTMWVNRIKTDNRHQYVVLVGTGKKKQALPVDAHNIDTMRRTIWDGDPKTLLVCFTKGDVRMRKILTRLAKLNENKKA